MPISVPRAMRPRLAPMWRINVPSSVASIPAFTTGSIAGKTRGLTSNARTTASQMTSKASNGTTNAAAPATLPGLLIGAIVYVPVSASVDGTPPVRGAKVARTRGHPMTTQAQHLDELLSTLRREMNALDVGDQDARQRLDRLILDIETRVRNPDAVAKDGGLGGQLKASVLKFEVSHPRLAGVINDVVDKLSAMGI